MGHMYPSGCVLHIFGKGLTKEGGSFKNEGAKIKIILLVTVQVKSVVFIASSWGKLARTVEPPPPFGSRRNSWHPSTHPWVVIFCGVEWSSCRCQLAAGKIERNRGKSSPRWKEEMLPQRRQISLHIKYTWPVKCLQSFLKPTTLQRSLHFGYRSGFFLL